MQAPKRLRPKASVLDLRFVQADLSKSYDECRDVRPPSAPVYVRFAP